MRLEELQVIHELSTEGNMSSHEVAALIQKADAQAKSVLGKMVEHGLVDARGTGRGRTYHLSAAVYRAIDAAPVYPRVRGFDRMQQEQMIVSFVRAHGSIRRAEAAELCSATPAQAASLLRNLVRTRRLEMVGERRWARYVEAQ